MSVSLVYQMCTVYVLDDTELFQCFLVRLNYRLIATNCNLQINENALVRRAYDEQRSNAKKQIMKTKRSKSKTVQSKLN